MSRDQFSFADLAGRSLHVATRAAVGFVVLSLVAGCSKKDEIRSYTVVKQPGSGVAPRGDDGAMAGEPSRMLGAIVPHGTQSWFFKLTGPAAPVSEQSDRFREFVQSVSFSQESEGNPSWKLPEGWNQQPGTGMRYATISIATPGAPLELTVIPLPYDGGDLDELALSNINRWRDQLQLSPIAKAQLATESERLKLADGTEAVVVNLVGRASATGAMGGAPFASAPFARSAVQDAGAATAASPLSYDVPEGWMPGKTGQMRKAAFEVHDGEQQVEITIIDLPASANGWLANVNRWRSQVKLGPVGEDALKEQTRTIQVGAITGDYVELESPAVIPQRQAILGVMAAEGDKAWFIKLIGDAALAEREKQRFEAFVRSIRFHGAGGAENGQ
jgi:hypothetical protein